MVRNFFLLSEVRSGSTYAAELIAYNFGDQHGSEWWGLAHEPFQQLTEEATGADLRAALGAIAVTPGGVRPAMIKCAHLETIDVIVDRDPDLRDEFFGPRGHWLVLRRGDLLAQAVSLHCALCSGSFHDYAAVPSCTPCRGTIPEVLDALSMISRSEEVLRNCEAKVANCLGWRYEDIIGNEAGFLESCHRYLYGTGSGFADRPLSGAKLVRAHSQEKTQLRKALADWLATRDAATPGAVPSS